MNFQNQVDYGQYFGMDVLEGVPAIDTLDRDVLKSHIMFRCGLLIPIYSEPETMQSAITHWFSYMRYDIDKMVMLHKTEYLPLENFRRNETETRDQWVTDDKTNTGTIGDSGGETITDTGTISDEYGSHNEHSVSAYNDSDYSPDNKDEGGGDNTRTLDTEREITRGNTRTLDLADNGVKHNADKVERLEFGNIGTMTTQDMFNQELDLLDRFNPYEWIVSKMETDLFLGIW